jgi:hypothetical protein
MRPTQRPPQEGMSLGSLVTGLVVIGLATMAWRRFGPDLRRYLKIESM